MQSGRLGGPSAAVDMHARCRDRFWPGVCAISVSLAGQRAQGKPGADCARSTACNRWWKKAHGVDRYSRGIPAFPAQRLYGLYVLSPVSGVVCHRCTPRTGGADRRHGRGARTTRLRRTLQTFRPVMTHLTLQASIATHATVRDDRETSLMATRADRNIILICGIVNKILIFGMERKRSVSRRLPRRVRQPVVRYRGSRCASTKIASRAVRDVPNEELAAFGLSEYRLPPT
jgi:hypothetical protein